MKNLAQRLFSKVLNFCFFVIRRDKFTFAKIYHRSDLETLDSKLGGWVIPTKLLSSDSICYCVGCGEDISFDLELIKRYSCCVFAFDPTPRAIAYVSGKIKGVKGYNFFDIGLWDREDTLKFYVPRNVEHVSHSLVNLQKTEDFIEVKVKRLVDIMKSLGHERIDLLKIDIEGAEYRVVDSIIDDNLDVRIICIEYDECFNPLDNKYKSRVSVSIAKLLAFNYKLICDRGNGNYTFLKEYPTK